VLWNVDAPMTAAAHPVLAVTATFSRPKQRMIAFRRWDLPLPAAPVMKTFAPRMASKKHTNCSFDKFSSIPK
jgi:hypothetical protein